MVAELHRAVTQLGFIGGYVAVGPTAKRMDHPGRVNHFAPFLRAREAQPSAPWRRYFSFRLIGGAPSYGVVVIAGGALDPPGGSAPCSLSGISGCRARALYPLVRQRAERTVLPAPIPFW